MIRFNKIIILAYLFLSCLRGNSQEVISYPDIQPQIRKAFHDQKNLKSFFMADTIEIPFMDDFARKMNYPDGRLWTDKMVFINKGYGLNPPSLGVATFDCYNERGEVYETGNSSGFAADTLTSVPINLSYSERDSIVLSFYWQAGGLGDLPEAKDSLIVQFYSPPDSSWTTIERMESSGERSFHMTLIPVVEDKYLQKGFRFRFINFASLADTREKGYLTNADHWNIDYVYLDTNRSVYDSSISDVAVVDPFHDKDDISPLPDSVFRFSSLHDDYESMPWKHYLETDITLNNDVNIVYRNNGRSILNVGRILRILDDNSTIEYKDGGSINILPSQTIVQPLFFREISFQDNTADSAVFTIKGYLKTDTDPSKLRKALRWNDTVVYQQSFNNYYAYDDGSAEVGYGINGQGTQNARIACKFHTYMKDTLQGLSIHFNQVKDQDEFRDIRIYFYLAVWANNNGKPGELIHVNKDEQQAAFTNRLNGFTYYDFDSSLAVQDTFYVGLIQTKEENLNIGFDYNRINNDKLFYNLQGEWRNSDFAGTLMLRPVMGADPGQGTGIHHPVQKEEPRFTIYPNPAKNYVSLHMDNQQGSAAHYHIQVYDLTGKTMLRRSVSMNETIDVTSLQQGIYLLRLYDGKGMMGTKKLIINE